MATTATTPKFHPGELLAQHAARTTAAAAELAPGLATNLSAYPFATTLLSSLPHIWLTTPPHAPSTSPMKNTPSLWLTPLFGPPGFVTTPSPTTVCIRPAVNHGRTGAELDIGVGEPAGLLAIDFATRRRFRVNGEVSGVERDSAGRVVSISIAVGEAFPNCPKYIFRRGCEVDESRLLREDEGEDRGNGHAGRAGVAEERSFEDDFSLSPQDVAQITTADTFFLGTQAHGRADANHRGGRPGFVRVLPSKTSGHANDDNNDDHDLLNSSPSSPSGSRQVSTTLLWPDYRGNGMFQSFGNIHDAANAVALTFLDFRSGRLLQLSGRATIIERSEAPSLLENIERAAMRAVRFDVHAVRRWIGPVSALRWTDVEPSFYNPPVLVPMKGGPENAENAVVSGQEEIDGPFPQTVTLVKIVNETHDVKTFRFLAERPVRFLPGQYATFEFSAGDLRTDGAVVPNDEDVVTRNWTLSEIANSRAGDVTLEVSIKRKASGLMSPFLHDHAVVGLRARLVGVDGDMTPFRHDFSPRSATTTEEEPILDTRQESPFFVKRVASRAGKLCLMSGGVGVTPNMAILRGVTASDRAADVAFVYQGRGEMPFAKEIARRARRSDGAVRVLQMVSGEDIGADGGPTEVDGVCVERGRVTRGAIERFVPDVAERAVFLCGPPGFMVGMSRVLGELGVDGDAIFTEKFDF